MTRSVLYACSPLLASKTPVWRSKLLVAAIAAGFVALAGRAAWVQVFGNDFFQRQGEVRLCPHPGIACQPRPHPGPQWLAAGHQRAVAQHLGDSGGRGA